MLTRRLEDRIRELSTNALATKDPDALHLVLSELQLAIHQYIERLRTTALAILGGRREFPQERRKTSPTANAQT
jgi:hypothetical protein